MKLFNIFVGLAVSQEGAPAEGARAMALAQRIKNAQDKCSFFMEKAMFCEPPNGKQGKYIHRLNKIMFDSVHHVKVGKCTADAGNGQGYGQYRKRRDDETDALDAEFDAARQELEDDFAEKGYAGSAPKPATVDRLENICRKYMATVWNAKEIQDCKKLGAWEKRSKGLLDDLTAMKNVCRNNKGSDGGNGGGNGGGAGYNAKPTKAPTKAPAKKPAYNKPKKPAKKPTKKPANKY